MNGAMLTQLLDEHGKRCLLERKVNNLPSKIDDVAARMRNIDSEIQHAFVVSFVQLLSQIR